MVNGLKTKGAALTLAFVAVWATLAIRFTVKSGVRGFYVNEWSTISASSLSRISAANFASGQGANTVAVYGSTSDMLSESGRSKIADLVLQYRRKGVRSVGYPYGSGNNVTNNLSLYNASVADSSKYDFVVSEIEPYNDNDYESFYRSLKDANDYCKKNGLQSAVYMGWPTPECWDTIVRYSSRVYLHCYRPSTSMSGASQFGYIRSRLNTIAEKAKGINKKISVVVIYSCEPEFAQEYFRTTDWWSPINSLKAYWSNNATPDVKKWISLDGTMIFVTAYAKQIR